METPPWRLQVNQQIVQCGNKKMVKGGVAKDYQQDLQQDALELRFKKFELMYEQFTKQEHERLAASMAAVQQPPPRPSTALRSAPPAVVRQTGGSTETARAKPAKPSVAPGLLPAMFRSLATMLERSGQQTDVKDLEEGM
jgi:hypothetical protein